MPALGPVIALLSQSFSDGVSYAPSSYVKWLEMAGARVTLIPYSADDSAVDKAFNQTNGALFIGGGSSTPPAARRFYANMLAARTHGDVYPIWGTCDGFEWLMQIGAGDDGILTGGFDSENMSVPVNLTAAATSSRLLAEAATILVQGALPRLSVLEALRSMPITLNNHQQGVAPQDFEESKLPSTYSILSTSLDRKGREFVAMVEGRGDLPVWATQFHPEKNIFEQARGLGGATWPFEAISHTRAAVAASQYFANFFVEQCRVSTHQFASAAEEWQSLVYRQTTSTAMFPSFLQIYTLVDEGN